MRKLIEKYSQTRGDLRFLCAIHVAGSKNKGSVYAFTGSILRRKGLKTGMFTSPHLVHPRERIRINGNAVCEEVFARHIIRLNSGLNRNSDQISYFRFIWILAVDIFKEAQVDVGIIEVSIGGRFDATNSIDLPVACGTTRYGSRIKRMVRFIKNNFPEITNLIDEENWLKRHVPTIAMKEFIA